eukprot:TRINITY_DN6502_c0_g1_i1.p1 TRINITY_DN6502_c0_g1~~TRINITY_DN6502_c0_g1_i1.p1  ORF type:complete len:674 (-),score=150.05 TRINITY_DN6502_c0_g1_i1:64-2058(-)
MAPPAAHQRAMSPMAAPGRPVLLQQRQQHQPSAMAKGGAKGYGKGAYKVASPAIASQQPPPQLAPRQLAQPLPQQPAPHPTQLPQQPQQLPSNMQQIEHIVGPYRLSLNGKLGEGEFASVWDATDMVSGTSLALKISSRVEECAYEVEVLRQLAARLPLDGEIASRVPMLKASGVGAAADGSRILKIAMTKVTGRTLDRWLYGMDAQAMKTVDIRTVLDCPLPGGVARTFGLAQSVTAAAELIRQVSSVFSILSTFAYHRDLAAHNVLVSNERGRFEFGVIDFGLSVDRARWHAGAWRQLTIAGDPRYWEPSSWVGVSMGMKTFDEATTRAYLERQDYHAMGVLVLEVLFGLWNGVDGGAAAAALRPAALAWRKFWAASLDCFQSFWRDHGMAARMRWAAEQRAEMLRSMLRELQAACRAASRAIPQGPAGFGAGPVLAACAEFIDVNSSITWLEAMRMQAPCTAQASCMPSPSPAPRRAKTPAPSPPAGGPAAATAAAVVAAASAAAPPPLTTRNSLPVQPKPPQPVTPMQGLTSPQLRGQATHRGSAPTLPLASLAAANATLAARAAALRGSAPALPAAALGRQAPTPQKHSPISTSSTHAPTSPKLMSPQPPSSMSPSVSSSPVLGTRGRLPSPAAGSSCIASLGGSHLVALHQRGKVGRV